MDRSEAIRKLCEEQNIRMIDFKMTDIDGRWRHITIPVERFGEDTFTYGIGFDGSNYGYAPVEKSDMVFLPDPRPPMWIRSPRCLHLPCAAMYVPSDRERISLLTSIRRM